MKTRVEINIPKEDSPVGEEIKFSKDIILGDDVMNGKIEERAEEAFDAFVEWITKYANICV